MSFITSRAGRRAAVLAVSALACAAAQAAATPEQLARIKLYGDVTIAQDSVSVWGPWEEFEPPAAGPLARDTVSLAPTREPYRPLPATTISPADPSPSPDPIVTLGCVAGSLCGYGVQDLFLGEDLPPSPAEPDTGLVYMVTVNPSGTAGSGHPILTDTITVTQDSWATGGSTTSAPLSHEEGPFFEHDATETGAQIDHTSADAVPDDINAVLYSYIEGGGPPVRLYGVVGRVTSAAGMAAVRADFGQRTATYAGWDYHPRSGASGSVNMEVNFNAATFSYTTSGGVQNYTATGVVRGSGYQATAFTTPNTTGRLQGNFIGSRAEGTVGAASVTQNGVLANTVHVTSRETPR